jgi:hypothetical protein
VYYLHRGGPEDLSEKYCGFGPDFIPFHAYRILPDGCPLDCDKPSLFVWVDVGSLEDVLKDGAGNNGTDSEAGGENITSAWWDSEVKKSVGGIFSAIRGCFGFA